MPKIDVVWDAAAQEFTEIPVRGPLTALEYQRRRRTIASMIVDEGLTVRQIADILGVHNSNIYRAVAGLIGHPFGGIPGAWCENKKQAPARARATVQIRAERPGASGEGQKAANTEGVS